MPDSAASMIASAAAGGGTKTILAFAPVFRTASAAVLNRSKPSFFVPPLPGATPPTSCVPYSLHCCEWNKPALPMPWVITVVFLSTRMLMVYRTPMLCRAACRSRGGRFERINLSNVDHRYENCRAHFGPWGIVDGYADFHIRRRHQ